MNMTRILPILLTLVLAGCATHLSEAGRRIRVASDKNSGGLAQCLRLGPVKGEADSFLSGGEYGVIYATHDARNKAARIPGADTLEIIDNESRRLGGEITGVAYNCAARPQTPAARAVSVSVLREEAPGKTAEPAAAAPGSGIFEKARKCQNKGGVWVNDACIIQID
jgi:hypothetical protein